MTPRRRRYGSLEQVVKEANATRRHALEQAAEEANVVGPKEISLPITLH
jgi:hypothetical protein